MTDFNVLAVKLSDPEAPRHFVTSLRETGFAILEDHPIEADDIAAMYETWAAFFTSAVRFEYAVKAGQQHGYFGFRSENAKDSPHKDLKEFYHVYQQDPVPQAVAAKTRAFHQKLLDIGAQLLGWLDQESPANVKAGLSEPLSGMIKGSRQNLLRILHYPPLPEAVEPGAVRAAAHEDINLITLLVTGSEPGLQAKDSHGTWHDVPCKDGYITVNAGDMLAKATGGYYPSTSHRVVNPPSARNHSRFSMPLFVHPRPEVRLDKSYRAGEYLEERLREIGLK